MVLSSLILVSLFCFVLSLACRLICFSLFFFFVFISTAFIYTNLVSSLLVCRFRFCFISFYPFFFSLIIFRFLPGSIYFLALGGGFYSLLLHLFLPFLLYDVFIASFHPTKTLSVTSHQLSRPLYLCFSLSLSAL